MWVIIQARLTSTRLPNKVLENFGGKPLINFIVDRISEIHEKVIVAIPNTTEQLPLKKHLYDSNILFSEGSENDVLDRYCRCATAIKANYIVRITSDCPLINLSTFHYMMHLTNKYKLDFNTNYPCQDGNDIEIMSYRCLEWCNRAARDERLAPDPRDLEHVTSFLKRESASEKMRQAGFRVNYYQEPLLNGWLPKTSIDTEEDLNQTRGIYAELGRQGKGRNCAGGAYIQ